MVEKSDYRKSINIQAVERALTVFEVLYQENREMGVNEIAQLMDAYPSTVYRVVNTLVNRGYLYQNPDSDKYGLNYKLNLLGRRVEENSSLIRIAKPYAKGLASKFKETVNVAIRETTNADGYTAITIFQENGSKRTLGVTETLLEPYECYYSGVGKALLAYSEDFDAGRVMAAVLEKHTENSFADNREMLEELLRVKKQGYAIDNEENEPGLFCVACPVLNRSGNAVMALSISGLKQNIVKLGVESIVSSLKDACREMSKQLL